MGELQFFVGYFNVFYVGGVYESRFVEDFFFFELSEKFCYFFYVFGDCGQVFFRSVEIVDVNYDVGFF